MVLWGGLVAVGVCASVTALQIKLSDADDQPHEDGDIQSLALCRVCPDISPPQICKRCGPGTRLAYESSSSNQGSLRVHDTEQSELRALASLWSPRMLKIQGVSSESTDIAKTQLCHTSAPKN